MRRVINYGLEFFFVSVSIQAVIQRCNELKQETSSLQTVVEMRSQELRNVTQQLELVSRHPTKNSIIS